MTPFGTTGRGRSTTSGSDTAATAAAAADVLASDGASFVAVEESSACASWRMSSISERLDKALAASITSKDENRYSISKKEGFCSIDMGNAQYKLQSRNTQY